MSIAWCYGVFYVCSGPRSVTSGRNRRCQREPDRRSGFAALAGDSEVVIRAGAVRVAVVTTGAGIAARADEFLRPEGSSINIGRARAG